MKDIIGIIITIISHQLALEELIELNMDLVIPEVGVRT
jgi:hypothetical protein